MGREAADVQDDGREEVRLTEAELSEMVPAREFFPEEVFARLDALREHLSDAASESRVAACGTKPPAKQQA